MDDTKKKEMSKKLKDGGVFRQPRQDYLQDSVSQCNAFNNESLCKVSEYEISDHSKYNLPNVYKVDGKGRAVYWLYKHNLADSASIRQHTKQTKNGKTKADVVPGVENTSRIFTNVQLAREKAGNILQRLRLRRDLFKLRQMFLKSDASDIQIKETYNSYLNLNDVHALHLYLKSNEPMSDDQYQNLALNLEFKECLLKKIQKANKENNLQKECLLPNIQNSDVYENQRIIIEKYLNRYKAETSVAAKIANRNDLISMRDKKRERENRPAQEDNTESNIITRSGISVKELEHILNQINFIVRDDKFDQITEMQKNKLQRYLHSISIESNISELKKENYLSILDNQIHEGVRNSIKESIRELTTKSKTSSMDTQSDSNYLHSQVSAAPTNITDACASNTLKECHGQSDIHLNSDLIANSPVHSKADVKTGDTNRKLLKCFPSGSSVNTSSDENVYTEICSKNRRASGFYKKQNEDISKQQELATQMFTKKKPPCCKRNFENTEIIDSQGDTLLRNQNKEDNPVSNSTTNLQRGNMDMEAANANEKSLMNPNSKCWRHEMEEIEEKIKQYKRKYSDRRQCSNSEGTQNLRLASMNKGNHQGETKLQEFNTSDICRQNHAMAEEISRQKTFGPEEQIYRSKITQNWGHKYQGFREDRRRRIYSQKRCYLQELKSEYKNRKQIQREKNPAQRRDCYTEDEMLYIKPWDRGKYDRKMKSQTNLHNRQEQTDENLLTEWNPKSEASDRETDNCEDFQNSKGKDDKNYSNNARIRKKNATKKKVPKVVYEIKQTDQEETRGDEELKISQKHDSKTFNYQYQQGISSKVIDYERKKYLSRNKIEEDLVEDPNKNEVFENSAKQFKGEALKSSDLIQRERILIDSHNRNPKASTEKKNAKERLLHPINDEQQYYACFMEEVPVSSESCCKPTGTNNYKISKQSEGIMVDFTTNEHKKHISEINFAGQFGQKKASHHHQLEEEEGLGREKQVRRIKTGVEKKKFFGNMICKESYVLKSKEGKHLQSERQNEDEVLLQNTNYDDYANCYNLDNDNVENVIMYQNRNDVFQQASETDFEDYIYEIQSRTRESSMCVEESRTTFTLTENLYTSSVSKLLEVDDILNIEESFRSHTTTSLENLMQDGQTPKLSGPFQSYDNFSNKKACASCSEHINLADSYPSEIPIYKEGVEIAKLRQPSAVNACRKRNKSTQMFEHVTKNDLYTLQWIHDNLFEININPHTLIVDEKIKEVSEESHIS